MQHGFIKVATASPPLLVGNCAHNAQQIVLAVHKAAKQGVHLLVLPQLSICGSTCGDLFLQQSLVSSAEEALKELCQQTKNIDMVLTVGLPVAHRGKLYNCAAVLYCGRVLGVVPKSFLPNEELRYFTPAFLGPQRVENGFLRGVPFGVQLLFSCAELPTFTFGVEIGEDLLTPSSPSVFHCTAGAAIIANLSAFCALAGGGKKMRERIAAQSARLVCGYIFANVGSGESSTDFTFAAENLIAENGATLAAAEPFCNDITVSDIDLQRIEHERRRNNLYPSAGREEYLTILFSMKLAPTALTRNISKTPFVPEDAHALTQRCEEVIAIQAAGLQKRVLHTCAKKLVVGVSGGLDSTLALLVAARVLKNLGRGNEDIVAISMPGFGTSARTRKNGDKLCEALGIKLDTIDIKNTVRAHFADISHDENTHDVVYENAQARVRALVLMDIANKQNGLVVGTGDLSELALGWATYNGDHMSMYAVNAGVPKTLIPHILTHEAKQNPALDAVLKDIIDTPVSPELLPPKNGEISQETQQVIGPYELHDFYLYYMLRWGFTPEKIYLLAKHAMQRSYTEEEIIKWLKVFYIRFFAQQFKRSCMPDGPKVGSVCLSPRGGLAMPSDAVVEEWLKQLKTI